MKRQLFFIRGKLVGHADRQMIRVHEKLVYPTGKAFFCPICSEVWFNAPVEGETSSCLNALCERHEYTDTIHGSWSLGNTCYSPLGSVWCGFDQDWNMALPDVVLDNELQAQIKFYEYQCSRRNV